MTGAESLVRTAVNSGVEVCFANPGTTEMDLVRAMDAVLEMRVVLGLFEGVCTGMADGYARMTGKPALTLLHLGPGLGNGIANLHNARRARSPVVNIVGDHPASHLPFDAPLTSDIATLARPVSHWVATAADGRSVGADMARAIAEALSPPGRIATLITPSDVLRGPADGPSSPIPPGSARLPGVEEIERVAKALRNGQPAALLLNGPGVLEKGLIAAHRVAAVTGCRVFSDCFPARLDRGAGIPPVERLPYFPDLILERLAGLKYLILAGATAPVSFFQYPGFPSSLVPEGCEVLTLARPEDHIIGALQALADALDAPADAGERTELSVPVPLRDELSTKSIGHAIGALLPERAIIADESATSGGPAYFLTRQCPPHCALYLTGGSIGMGLPLAAGAAVACPDRTVIALQGDGGGMYTLQALWTQAREGLNVTNIIFANRKYQVLRVELARAGAVQPGPKTHALTDLSHPEIDWCALAKGMGVPATRPASGSAFYNDLKRALDEPGPHLIEVVV